MFPQLNRHVNKPWYCQCTPPSQRDIACMKLQSDYSFNPIRGKNPPSTRFPTVTSINVGIRPQNFLTFTFNHFVTLVQNFRTIASAIPKLLNLNQEHHSKKLVFLVNWSNPYKFEVIITSLIEMLHLPNFGHMTTYAIKFESRDKVLLI